MAKGHREAFPGRIECGRGYRHDIELDIANDNARRNFGRRRNGRVDRTHFQSRNTAIGIRQCPKRMHAVTFRPSRHANLEMQVLVAFVRSACRRDEVSRIDDISSMNIYLEQVGIVAVVAVVSNLNTHSAPFTHLFDDVNGSGSN